MQYPPQAGMMPGQQPPMPGQQYPPGMGQQYPPGAQPPFQNSPMGGVPPARRLDPDQMPNPIQVKFIWILLNKKDFYINIFIFKGHVRESEGRWRSFHHESSWFSATSSDYKVYHSRPRQLWSAFHSLFDVQCTGNY